LQVTEKPNLWFMVIGQFFYQDPINKEESRCTIFPPCIKVKPRDSYCPRGCAYAWIVVSQVRVPYGMQSISNLRLRDLRRVRWLRKGRRREKKDKKDRKAKVYPYKLPTRERESFLSAIFALSAFAKMPFFHLVFPPFPFIGAIITSQKRAGWQ
jgi:hypothetical protein